MAVQSNDQSRLVRESEMNYIDLFSGVGGFALGAYWAGMHFVKHYYSEIEPYAAKLYQQRFPHAIPLGDICKIDGLSLAGSPAKTYQLPAQEPESRVPGRVFGLKCGELLGTYDPSTQSLKTLELSLFEGWTPSLVRLPRSGMMRNGRIYEQATWVRRTEGKGSGLLHTPTAKANQDAPAMQGTYPGSWWPTPRGPKYGPDLGKMERENRTFPTDLETAVAMEWFPTPSASMMTIQDMEQARYAGNDPRRLKYSEAFPTPRATDGNKPAYGDKNHQGLQARIQFPTPSGLSANQGQGDGEFGKAIRNSVKYPSPAARDHKSGAGRKENGHSPQLPEVIGEQLNPQFVEWLMNYPRNWTDMDYCGIIKNAKKTRSNTILQELQHHTETKEVWGNSGEHEQFHATEVLQSEMHGQGSRDPESGAQQAQIYASQETIVRDLREYREYLRASQGRELQQQYRLQFNDAVRFVSHVLASQTGRHADKERENAMLCMRKAIVSAWALSYPPNEIQEIWESLSDKNQNWAIISACLGPWHSEWPDIGRLATGIPKRVDRLRGLGNAIVPQIAELLFRQIKELL